MFGNEIMNDAQTNRSLNSILFRYNLNPLDCNTTGRSVCLQLKDLFFIKYMRIYGFKDIVYITVHSHIIC